MNPNWNDLDIHLMADGRLMDLSRVTRRARELALRGVRGGAGDYTDQIDRAETDDPLVPTPVSADIIQAMVQTSAVMARARKAPMSAKTQRQPVLSVLPQAYFVTGDTGLKQTSAQAWENLSLVAEELAVIVPIPQAYLDDAQVPIWDQVKPRIAEALGKQIDLSCLFGIGKPSTWGDAIVLQAVTQGNVVTEGTTDDLASDVALVAQSVGEDGFGVDGWTTGPAFRWRMIGLRASGSGVPIYAPPAGDQPGTLYGYPIGESMNGGWLPQDASLLAGDWSNAVLGTRQDISFQLFTEGVITDDDGNIIVNLMQQDMVALRAVARFGWAVANPVTAVNENDATRYPFGVLEPRDAS